MQRMQDAGAEVSKKGAEVSKQVSEKNAQANAKVRDTFGRIQDSKYGKSMPTEIRNIGLVGILRTVLVTRGVYALPLCLLADVSAGGSSGVFATIVGFMKSIFVLIAFIDFMVPLLAYLMDMQTLFAFTIIAAIIKNAALFFATIGAEFAGPKFLLTPMYFAFLFATAGVDVVMIYYLGAFLYRPADIPADSVQLGAKEEQV